MPNWVHNKVKIDKKFNEIAELVKSDNIDENGDYEEFDFEKIVPMPKSLDLTSGGSEDYAIQYAMKRKSEKDTLELIHKLKDIRTDFYGNYLSKIFRYSKNKNDDNTNVFYDNETLNKMKETFENETLKQNYNKYEELGIKSFEDLGNTYINNILNYGNDTWYDWSCENWGTKWNCTNTYAYENDKMFEFDTAWSCPVPIIIALSKKFKGVNFIVEYADENLGYNCGTIEIENGEIISNEDGDLDFALDTWGYDKEDYYKMC